jgi:prolipoprotein diacylglyceryltransferase
MDLMAVPAGTKSLAIADLVINLILIQPITYILWKHGKRGLLGWLYLHILCAIRIVGNAIEIHGLTTHTRGTAATILSSVSLSPLILAAVGVLHESYVSRFYLHNGNI